jgi:hypothetical protein
MASTFQTLDLSAFPPELVQFATQEAKRDAVRAGAFLYALGIAKRPGPPVELPADFLLNLGALLRLLEWERNGISVHQEAGLSAAKAAEQEMLQRMVSRIGKKPKPDLWLSNAVFGLLIENFAWTAQQNLQADIQLDFPDEDALVEAMAQFLWSQRTSPSTQQGCTP